MPAPAKEFDRVRSRPVPNAPGFSVRRLFLALTAKPAETSPTARGLFVREQFLCQHVAEPPPGVNTNLPAVTEAKPQTNRERMAEHSDQSELCDLPRADRSDRLRLREVRRHRGTAGKVHASVLSRQSAGTSERRRRRWNSTSTPRQCCRHCGFAVFFAARTG